MYILILSWIFISPSAHGDVKNTQMTTASFQNQAACLNAAKEAANIANVKAVCVPSYVSKHDAK